VTKRLSDEILVAYVDGELPSEQARDVEAQIAADPELAVTAEALRAGSSALHAAFNEPLRAPIPDRLIQVLGAPAAPDRRSFSWRWFTGPLAAPIAVSVLALVVGLGSAFMYADWRIERKIAGIEATRAADRQMIADAVALALESNVSGKLATWRNPNSGSYGTVEPVRTFRAAGGEWCREYVQTVDLITESFQPIKRRAIACRETDGQWRTRMEIPGTNS
jgi:surface antigen